MRPPVNISANSVNIAHLERLSKPRNRADLQVGLVVFDLENEGGDNGTTPAMTKAYKQWAVRQQVVRR